MKRYLPLLWGVLACHHQSVGTPRAVDGIVLEPVAVTTGQGSGVAGVRLINESAAAIVVCATPIVRNAADSKSGQLLVQTGPITQHQDPKIHGLCPVEWGELLAPGDATIVADLLALLGAEHVNLSVVVQYWSVSERKAIVIERTFEAVPVLEPSTLQSEQERNHSCR